MLHLPAWYYQQFDCDPYATVPAATYGGWLHADFAIDPRRTALVVMHAWDTGTPDAFPGWHCVEDHIPRCDAILRDVFPPLLASARAASLPILHVTGCGRYYQHLPGYLRAQALAGPPPPPAPRAAPDPSVAAIRQFKSAHSFPGSHNQADIQRGFAALDFPAIARPLDHEGIADTPHLLSALCRDADITHLIYVGFAINWCLQFSAAGIIDMARLGYLCSTVRQATTAVENRESGHGEIGKELALWKVAIDNGLVFDADTLITALRTLAPATPPDAAN